MSDPNELLNDRQFLAVAEKTFKTRKVTPMTRGTHPDLMELYSALCKKRGITERPVFVAESAIVNAVAYFPAQAIIISSQVADHLPQQQVCAAMGHEGGHLSRRQMLRNFFRLFTAMSVPLDIAGVDAGLRKAGLLSPHSPPVSFAKFMVAMPLTGLAAILGVPYANRADERDCDVAGAELAGAEAMQGYNLAAATGNREPSILERIFGNYPSFKDRNRHLERRFKILPKGEPPLPGR